MIEFKRIFRYSLPKPKAALVSRLQSKTIKGQERNEEVSKLEGIKRLEKNLASYQMHGEVQ